MQRAIHRLAHFRQDLVDNRRKRVYELFERTARQKPEKLDGCIDLVLDKIVRKDGAASVHMLFESFALTTQVRPDLTGHFLDSVYQRNPDHMLLAFMVTLDDAVINDQALRTVLFHDTPCGHARNFLLNWAVGKGVTTGQYNEMRTILDWPAESTCNCSILEHPLSAWANKSCGMRGNPEFAARALALLVRAGFDPNIPVTFLKENGQEHNCPSLLDWVCHQHNRTSLYALPIELLLDLGVDWEGRDLGTEAAACVIRAHPVWRKRQLTETIHGQPQASSIEKRRAL